MAFEPSAIAAAPATTSKTSYLTQEETRKILTPFAFEIDKSLFGIPLAGPWKRGLAITFDFLLVAMLSEAPGELLAIVIAITLFRLGNKKRTASKDKEKGRKRRAILRFISAMITLVILLEQLPNVFNVFDSDINGGQDSATLKINDESRSLQDNIILSALTISTVKSIAQSDCEQVSCWRAELTPVIEKAGKLDLDEQVITDVLSEIASATDLGAIEQDQLTQQLLVQFQTVRLARANDKKLPKSGLAASKKVVTNVGDVPMNTGPEKNAGNVVKTEKPVYSLIEWSKGIIEDLGLGFGWAAFYFTMFTALWHGQTPGKKLVGIKVLQLDGTPISIIDGFNRYGGYAAGIATGLLGFLQVFWDPNRQAIHDKISATVVIDIKKAERENFSHELL